MIRTRIKTGAAHALCATGMTRLFGLLSRLRKGPLVILYHRVVEDFESSIQSAMPSLLVTRHTLEQHVECIGRHFRFVSLDELGARLASRKGLREPAVAITFDDGYQDFYYHAAPVLRERGIPAAVFVVSDMVGTNGVHAHDALYLLLRKGFASGVLTASTVRELTRPFAATLPHDLPDTPYAATRALLNGLSQADVQAVVEALKAKVPVSEESLRPFYSLTWEMLNDVRTMGITIGSHGKTHALMTQASPQRMMDEATESRAEIERRLGIRVEHFAYPDGQFDTASVDAVRAAGYRFGYTICAHRDSRHPELTVSRIGLWENSSRDSRGAFSPAILQCQTSRVFDFAGRCRQHHGAHRAGPTDRER